jgi:RNA polymerase sigma-70 factor (ECF subfamily)
MTAEEFKKDYFSLHSKLYGIARTILNNAEDAEDITGDLYCKLWDEREKLAEVKNPTAYCVTLVKHSCIDFLRTSKSLNSNSIDEYDFADNSDTPDVAIERQETVNRVKSLIGKLPEKQQRILRLQCFSGCTFEEIERITGESAVNVRVLLSRARNTLRTKINY